MDYSKRVNNKETFRLNAFKLFTDACGGDSQVFADTLYARYTVEDFAFSDDMNHSSILQYFKKTVIPHKIAVYQAGIELLGNEKLKPYFSEQMKEDFMRNLWLHDMSKFSANESLGYAMYNRETGHGKENFELAWHHHKVSNPHHPEYWHNPNRSGELEPLPMLDIYVLEMIADWIGAGRTYGGTLEEWLPKNISTFKFANTSKVAEIIRNATGANIKIENGCLIIE